MDLDLLYKQNFLDIDYIQMKYSSISQDNNHYLVSKETFVHICMEVLQ